MESHLFPYDVVTRRVGPMKDRYGEFLERRAALVWQEIEGVMDAGTSAHP